MRCDEVGLASVDARLASVAQSDVVMLARLLLCQYIIGILNGDDVLEQLESALQQLPHQNWISIDFLLDTPKELDVAYMSSDEDIVVQILRPSGVPEEENEDEVTVRSEYNVTQAETAMEQKTLF
ncbi:hypothetical protein BG011_000032 [Mortierella polycephala]|uniref:Uncharacterized protein n=1 Tax=Mortierella polycephala TaxID=41804 RepID=A0A9P6QH14_9FUNG|nr:hypothetical protein BG011_000032 [Mortierella polycephala]